MAVGFGLNMSAYGAGYAGNSFSTGNFQSMYTGGWQNNIGNIATNAFGMSNFAFGGKGSFDWKNLSLNYTGGVIDKFYDPKYWYSGFGAHSVIGNSQLFKEHGLYAHELHHLWQSRAFGDVFLLNYGLQGIGAMLMGGSFLQGYNYFEDQA